MKQVVIGLLAATALTGCVQASIPDPGMPQPGGPAPAASDKASSCTITGLIYRGEFSDDIDWSLAKKAVGYLAISTGKLQRSGDLLRSLQYKAPKVAIVFSKGRRVDLELNANSGIYNLKNNRGLNAIEIVGFKRKGDIAAGETGKLKIVSNATGIKWSVLHPSVQWKHGSEAAFVDVP